MYNLISFVINNNFSMEFLLVSSASLRCSSMPNVCLYDNVLNWSQIAACLAYSCCLLSFNKMGTCIVCTVYDLFWGDLVNFISSFQIHWIIPLYNINISGPIINIFIHWIYFRIMMYAFFFCSNTRLIIK